jgi:hypothetical protein
MGLNNRACKKKCIYQQILKTGLLAVMVLVWPLNVILICYKLKYTALRCDQ